MRQPPVAQLWTRSRGLSKGRKATPRARGVDMARKSDLYPVVVVALLVLVCALLLTRRSLAAIMLLVALLVLQATHIMWFQDRGTAVILDPRQIPPNIDAPAAPEPGHQSTPAPPALAATAAPTALPHHPTAAANAAAAALGSSLAAGRQQPEPRTFMPPPGAAAALEAFRTSPHERRSRRLRVLPAGGH